MKRCFTALAWLLIIVSAVATARAQINECPEPINGTLKGEAGNDQDNMFHSLAIDPTDDRIVYVGTETNGIFKTTDAGATWTRLRAGLKCTTSRNLYPEIFDIAVAPSNHLVVYVASVTGPGPSSPVTFPSASAGVYKSFDGGQSWIQKNNGLPNTYVTQVLVDSTNPDRVYAVVGGLKASFPANTTTFYDGGIYVSDDGANNWAPLTLPIGAEKNTFTEAVLRGSDQRTIYASGQVHKGEAPVAFGLIRSTDAGATWTVSNPLGEVVQGFDAFKADPKTIYANLNSGSRVRKSTDGGTTWTALGPTIFFGTVKIHPANSQIAYYTGSPTGSIWKTTDGFATVQQVYADPTLASGQIAADIEIAPSNPNVIWEAVNGYYLYRSTDGGASWTKITAIRDMVYSGATGSNTNTGDSITTLGPLKFDDNSSVKSFLRIFNSSNVVRNVQVTVRDEGGTQLGSFFRQLDPFTAPQIGMAEIESLAKAARPARAGTFAQIEINGDFSGHAQHVQYDTNTGVLTNVSICRTSRTGMSAATGAVPFAGNVHTTSIPTNPSKILLQNAESTAKAVAVDVYDATTGSKIGTWTSPTLPVGGSVVVPLSQIQTELKFVPTANQYHLNLINNSASKFVLGHLVDNAPAGIQTDMSVWCSF